MLQLVELCAISVFAFGTALVIMSLLKVQSFMNYGIARAKFQLHYISIIEFVRVERPVAAL